MKKEYNITLKISKEIYSKLVISIPKGERSSFIRNAIFEKLENIPSANKILELEKKISKIDNDLSEIKNCLADLEILTYEKGKINPHVFCVDQLDHSIINYLIHHKGATTPELSENLNFNRWIILSHLKKIQNRSKKQLGQSIINYFSGKKSGKMRAWWLNKKLI